MAVIEGTPQVTTLDRLTYDGYLQLAQLLAAHRLWSDWLRDGRVRTPLGYLGAFASNAVS